MPLRIVLCGDSRVEGAGDKKDFPQIPGPATNYGTAYSTDVGVTINVIPQASAPGTGFTCGVKRIPSTGLITCFIQTRGSGYVANQMPSLTVSGGSGTPPDFVLPVTPAGGFTVRLENYLLAHGFPGVQVIDMGIDGGSMQGWATTGKYNLTVAEGSAGDPANSLIYLDVGINDINGGRTPQQYHDDLLSLANAWVADGYTVMVSYPYGVGSYSPAAELARNPTTQSLSTQIDAVIATNPAKILKGIDGYSLITANDSYFNGPGGDNLHCNSLGYDAMTAVLGPRIVEALAPPPVTTYNSAPSNEVSTTTGFVPVTPVITAFSGMSTYPNPQVSLTWGAGNWLRILVQMMTVGGAGNLGTFQTVLTIAEAVPGDASSVPTTIVLNNTNLPPADAMAFGVQYKFRLIAQGG